MKNPEQESAGIESSEPSEKPTPILRPRQMEMLEFIARGFSNLQISKSLGIPYQTVKNLLSMREECGCPSDGIFARLNIHSRREAVVKAIALGLLNPQELVSEEEMERCELLTGRQVEVLSWLANPTLSSFGTQSAEVGKELGISKQTIKNHLTAIYKKLEMKVEGKQKSARAAVIFSAYQRREK